MKVIDNPILMKEWDWEANNKEGIDPSRLTLGMNRKVNWICAKGHKWKASICVRNFSKSGCPFCRNSKVWPGYNDLATTNPELLKEWHPSKNTKLTPTTVRSTSYHKAWWKCANCGHIWQRTVYERNYGSKCPHCHGLPQLPLK